MKNSSNDYNPNYVEEKVFFRVGQKIVIFNPEGKILLVRRSDKLPSAGEWSLVGGALDQSETPLAGILREVEEEANIHVTSVKPFFTSYYINEYQENVLMIFYIGTTQSLKPQLNWEHDEYVWTTKEEAKKLIQWSILNEALEKI